MSHRKMTHKSFFLLIRITYYCCYELLQYRQQQLVVELLLLLLLASRSFSVKSVFPLVELYQLVKRGNIRYTKGTTWTSGTSLICIFPVALVVEQLGLVVFCSCFCCFFVLASTLSFLLFYANPENKYGMLQMIENLSMTLLSSFLFFCFCCSISFLG